LDGGKVTVQPAGSAGKRHVFLTLSFSDDITDRQVEFVLTELAAQRFGEALLSGSAGVKRELELTDGSESE
jgi:hypothetical protein